MRVTNILLSAFLFLAPILSAESLFAQSQSNTITWKTYSGGTDRISLSFDFPESGPSDINLDKLKDTLLVYYFGRDFIGLTPQGAVNIEARLLESSPDADYSYVYIDGSVKQVRGLIQVSVRGAGSNGGSQEFPLRNARTIIEPRSGWKVSIKDILTGFGIPVPQFERWIKEELMFAGYTSDAVDFAKVTLAACEFGLSKDGLIVFLSTSVLRDTDTLLERQMLWDEGPEVTIPWNRITKK